MKRRMFIYTLFIFTICLVGCSKTYNIKNNSGETIITKCNNKPFTEDEIDEVYKNMDYNKTAISIDGKEIIIYKTKQFED